MSLSILIFLGEFGIIYKGHMIKHHNNGQYLDEYIAIKTLKGTCIIIKASYLPQLCIQCG